MKNIRTWIVATFAACLLFTGCGANGGGVRDLTPQQSDETLKTYFEDTSKISINRNVELIKDSSQDGTERAPVDLPAIEKFPVSIQGTGQIDIEIFSSTEKSNSDRTGWLDVIADRFNRSGKTVNGHTVSVTVRPISSGRAMDYITSRQHIPAAYSPSNELWGKMIATKGVEVKTIETRLARNVAGYLMRQDTYDKVVQKYGSVNTENMVKAVVAGDLTLGHTDPNQSSTGLNMLTQELLALDPSNPLSPKAIEAFRKFQEKVPPVSNTTAEMIRVAENNPTYAVTMEAQAWATNPKLATGWVFTPAGERHDSPLLALGNLSNEQLEVAKLFGAFALSEESQRTSTELGFNQFNDYAAAKSKLSGTQLFSILDVWKQNKDAGVPVVTVFVVDHSSSMQEYSKMQYAQNAMFTAARHINPNSYVGIVSYDDQLDLVLPIKPFDKEQRAYFTGAVNHLKPRGNTHTSSAVIAALNEMRLFREDFAAKNPGKNPFTEFKFRIILLTDGVQTGGFAEERAIELVHGLSVPTYGISFVDASTTKSLEKLATANESGYVITVGTEDAAVKIRDLVRAVS